MRLVCISDLHTFHDEIGKLPEGDCLIVAGDVSFYGKRLEIEDFAKWFKKQDFKYKVLIAGNHDYLFERKPEEAKEILGNSCIYLQGNYIQIEGLTLYGDPNTPFFFDWAFNVQRGKDIKRIWDHIPTFTDVLITHGPPYGILDKNREGQSVGCQDLYNRIQIVKPKLHIFGHIHEGYGTYKDTNTEYINCSICTRDYDPINKPIVVDI